MNREQRVFLNLKCRKRNRKGSTANMKGNISNIKHGIAKIKKIQTYTPKKKKEKKSIIANTLKRNTAEMCFRKHQFTDQDRERI